MITSFGAVIHVELDEIKLNTICVFIAFFKRKGTR